MFRTVATICACFLLLLAVAFAQGGAATGDLHVIVKDAQGQVVTSATVVVRDLAKGIGLKSPESILGNGEYSRVDRVRDGGGYSLRNRCWQFAAPRWDCT